MLRPTVIAMATGATVLAALIAPPSVAAAEPVVGACYDYSRSALETVSSTAAPIPCTAKHTAETYLVRTLPDSFGPPSKASTASRLSAAEACSVSAMNTHVGWTDRRLPSRFLTAVLFPTNEQWKAGERWMRCDVVLQGGTALVTVTKPMAEVVAAAPAEQFDFCTPGTPNAKNTSAFPCTKPKVNWIKVLDKDLGSPGTAFPGTRTVENRTKALCRAQGKQWNGKEKYPGWWAIWPTAKGWKEGRRSAQCFVPYSQYQAELAGRAPAPAPTSAPEVVPPA